MRVSKRERETLHSCFTTRHRIFDDLAVSTSHPPKNQGRVTEWSRAAEKSRPIYTHSSTAPLTLERLLHAALYGLSSDSTTSIYSSLYDVEKKRDDHLTCHLWRHSSVCQTLNLLFVFFCKSLCVVSKYFQMDVLFFSFLHIDIASRRSMATWCYLFSWNWIPWSRVLVYYILIRRSEPQSTGPQHKPFRGKELILFRLRKKKFANFERFRILPTSSIFFHCRLK